MQVYAAYMPGEGFVAGMARKVNEVPEIITDPELLAFGDHCVDVCAREFNRCTDTWPRRFEVWSETAQPQFRAREGRIILKQGCNWWQLRSQVGHEVFHWLCTPGSEDIFHWTHEVLAQEMSIRCIRSATIVPPPPHDKFRDGRPYGVDDYADEAEAEYRREAISTSLEKMLTTELVPPYEWVRGRAFVVGRKLATEVGWEQLKRVATYFDEAGKPDVRRWLRDLPRPDRRRATRVLGPPKDDWV
jgi:hypothetical protein